MPEEATGQAPSGMAFEKIDTTSLAPWMGVVNANPGMGKTFLSMTLSVGHQVYIADSEFRAVEVARKDFLSRKLKDGTSLAERIHIRTIPDWNELEFFCQSLLDHLPGVVVFDSGTEIQSLAEAAFLASRGKDRTKVSQLEWGYIDQMFRELLRPLRHAGFHILFTTEPKEIYRGDTGTDTYEPRMRSAISRRADFVLFCEVDDEKKTREWQVTKCAWHPYEEWGNFSFPVRGSSLGKIISTLRSLTPPSLKSKDKDNGTQNEQGGDE